MKTKAQGDTIETRLRAIVCQLVNLPEFEITLDATWEADLGADSLDLAEIVMDAEAAFGIEIDDEIIDDLPTFGALCTYVRTALARKAGAA